MTGRRARTDAIEHTTTGVGRPLTLHGLKVIRAELAGQIADMEARLDGLRADLLHLDHTLAFLGVDAPMVKAKSLSVSGLFLRGELPRLIMGEFRRSQNRPLTAREIACSIIKGKGWDMNDHRLTDAITAKIGRILDKWKKRGALDSRRHDGKAHEWWLVR